MGLQGPNLYVCFLFRYYTADSCLNLWVKTQYKQVLSSLGKGIKKLVRFIINYYNWSGIKFKLGIIMVPIVTDSNVASSSASGKL